MEVGQEKLDVFDIERDRERERERERVWSPVQVVCLPRICSDWKGKVCLAPQPTFSVRWPVGRFSCISFFGLPWERRATWFLCSSEGKLFPLLLFLTRNAFVWSHRLTSRILNIRRLYNSNFSIHTPTLLLTFYFSFPFDLQHPFHSPVLYSSLPLCPRVRQTYLPLWSKRLQRKRAEYVSGQTPID